MMKTILLILFAITSSSALAQRHVPGGGPVGSPGNPGTHHPVPQGPHGNPYPGPVHVPGGGPQGPAHGGGVIVIQPSYPVPSYPSCSGYNCYPTPSYPTPSYPSPSYPSGYLGPCVINSTYNGSYTYYTVYDGRGNYISSYYDFGQAMRTAQNYDQMGYCRGIKDQTGGAYPNPYPTPYPQTYCSVMPGSDAYGRQFYRVLDRAGRIIYTSPDYNQALNVSRTDARCFQY